MYIFKRFLPSFSLLCRDLILKETFNITASWGDRGRQMGKGGASRGHPCPTLRHWCPLTTISYITHTIVSTPVNFKQSARGHPWSLLNFTCYLYEMNTVGNLAHPGINPLLKTLIFWPSNCSNVKGKWFSLLSPCFKQSPLHNVPPREL